MGGDLLGKIESVHELIHKYPSEPRFVLPLLQDIQETEKYLPVEAMKAVASYLGVPESRVYAVATFYGSLSLKKKGEKIVRVCMGTACHLRGAGALAAELEKELGIKNGQTSPDGLFSLESVNCLGACALAPVMTVNEEVHGGVAPAAIHDIIQKERAQ